MRPRTYLASALTVSAWLLAAGPASAHEEINPRVVQTGRPTYFTLSAADEKDVDLIGITVTAPGGVPFGEITRVPSGWTSKATEESVTYSGGAVHPGSFESFGFEIESADQPGELRYGVRLMFDGGDSEETTVVVQAQASVPGAERATQQNDSRANIALALAALAILGVLVTRLLRPSSPSAAAGKAATDW